MNIYYIITKHDHYDDSYIVTLDVISYYSRGHLYGFYKAETRGKAKYAFCKEHRIELLEPVIIRKVPDCDTCNSQGFLGTEYDPRECPGCNGKSYRPDNI